MQSSRDTQTYRHLGNKSDVGGATRTWRPGDLAKRTSEHFIPTPDFTDPIARWQLYEGNYDLRDMGRIVPPKILWSVRKSRIDGTRHVAIAWHHAESFTTYLTPTSLELREGPNPGKNSAKCAESLLGHRTRISASKLAVPDRTAYLPFREYALSDAGPRARRSFNDRVIQVPLERLSTRYHDGQPINDPSGADPTSTFTRSMSTSVASGIQRQQP